MSRSNINPDPTSDSGESSETVLDSNEDTQQSSSSHSYDHEPTVSPESISMESYGLVEDRAIEDETSRDCIRDLSESSNETEITTEVLDKSSPEPKPVIETTASPDVVDINLPSDNVSAQPCCSTQHYLEESKQSNPISLQPNSPIEVSVSRSGVTTSEDAEICSIALQSEKTEDFKSDKKSPVLDFESSLGNTNPPEENLLRLPHSIDISSVDIDTSSILDRNIPILEETSDFGSPSSVPDLFSPNSTLALSNEASESSIDLKLTSGISSGYSSPIISSEVSKMEVSPIQPKSKTVQAFRNTGDSDVLIILSDDASKKSTGKTKLPSFSSGDKEVADFVESEDHSPVKKPRMSAPGKRITETGVKPSIKKTDLTSSESSEFEKYRVNPPASFVTFDTEFKSLSEYELFKQELELEISKNTELGSILSTIKKVYEEFVLCKVFLKEQFPFTSEVLMESLSQCYSSFKIGELEFLPALIFKALSSVPEKSMEVSNDKMKLRWCECWIIVDFLAKTSINLLKNVQKAEQDAKQDLLQKLKMFNTISSYLYTWLEELNGIEVQMDENKFYKSLRDLNSALRDNVNTFSNFISRNIK